MSYYKKGNEVFWFDDDQSELITDEFIEMSADQIDRHLNPEKYLTNEQKNEIALNLLKAKAKAGLSESSIKISILSDKIELGIYDKGETEESVSESLLQWRKYRISCNSIISGNSTELMDKPE